MQYINKPVEQGIYLERQAMPQHPQYTTVATNVRHSIVYHSPDGFEWGYAGSGPAELALNLAELVVRKAKLETTEGIHCSMMAWYTKQTVKELLIVHLPYKGAFIPWKLVCYAVLDACQEGNRETLQEYIDNLD
ncbi:MAG: hypothetical protein KAJ19_08740 [Gammaproteobacteria bacterium]|nr:hypothetical protein [Gammaproteobacteria bacterium]